MNPYTRARGSFVPAAFHSGAGEQSEKEWARFHRAQRAADLIDASLIACTSALFSPCLSSPGGETGSFFWILTTRNGFGWSVFFHTYPKVWLCAWETADLLWLDFFFWSMWILYLFSNSIRWLPCQIWAVFLIPHYQQAYSIYYNYLFVINYIPVLLVQPPAIIVSGTSPLCSLVHRAQNDGDLSSYTHSEV